MKKVTKHTRASRSGREIVCPMCLAKHIVYHFSWFQLTCMSCKVDVWKKDWLVAEGNK